MIAGREDIQRPASCGSAASRQPEGAARPRTSRWSSRARASRKLDRGATKLAFALKLAQRWPPGREIERPRSRRAADLPRLQNHLDTQSRPKTCPAGPQRQGASRWGAGDRAKPKAFLMGRAAVQPGRQAARADERRGAGSQHRLNTTTVYVTHDPGLRAMNPWATAWRSLMARRVPGRSQVRRWSSTTPPRNCSWARLIGLTGHELPWGPRRSRV